MSERFIPIQDGYFWGSSQMYGVGQKDLPKIFHIHLSMMKLDIVIFYLKELQRIYESRDTTLSYADTYVFHQKSATFVISKNADIGWILIHKLYLFQRDIPRRTSSEKV